MRWTRKHERKDSECEEVRVGERKNRNIKKKKKKIKQGESVGVRDGGSKSGEKEGRESGMAAHQS